MRRYIIPIVKEKAQVHRICPRCQEASGQIHQKRKQTIVDTKLGGVTKVRMQCYMCSHMDISTPWS